MYNNPFFYNNASSGLLSSLKNIGWGTILSNTQKTLGIINQAIPIIYQVKPLISNMGTAFKIASEINKPDEKDSRENDNYQTDSAPTDKPIFYI